MSQMPTPREGAPAAELFAKIKPRMTPAEAVIEASRCLFCHDAPCTIACPSSIDIPMFIRKISSGNTQGAARTIFTQNILGKSCAYVCPTQVLCEGSCVYHGLNEKPIDIGRLQGFASDHAIESNVRFFHPNDKNDGQSNGQKVAVIGGGPAGLSCAHELTRLGYLVTVFEASPKAGGLNMYGVAPYKLDNAGAAEEVAYVQGIGFEVRTNTRVTAEPQAGAVSLPELEKEFDAIFLALGLGKSNRPGLPGEQLSGVHGAAKFIYELREKEQKIAVGKRVVVIGAGNTAIDAAVESAKLGAKVTMAYRRTPQDQSAYDFEVEHARHAEVEFLYLTSPLEILGTDRVEGLRCIQNRVESGDGTGRSNITPIPGSEFVLPCDRVIFATGQEKQVGFFKAIPGLTLDRDRVAVNERYQTTNPKYFAGGDCVNGGKEVVNAVAHGRDAARGIDAWLASLRTPDNNKQLEAV